MMPILRNPRIFPHHTLRLLRTCLHPRQDIPSKSSYRSKPKRTRKQTLRPARVFRTTSKAYQHLPFLNITLLHRSGPQRAVGLQVLKQADVGIMTKLIAGGGKVALIPMNRRTVIASSLIDAGIDNLRHLRRVRLSATIADLPGRKFALGRVPDRLLLAPCHRRGNRLTDCPHTALPEARHHHYSLVAATKLQIRATCVTVTTITHTPDMILPVIGVMTAAVTIAENRQRTTMRATSTTPQGHHIVTITIGATKGTLMDPDMSPLATGLWPMITVQFPHDNPP